MKKYLFIFLLTIVASLQSAQAQDEDALFVKSIYDFSLTESTCYSWLEFLTQNIGGRLAGSPASLAAVYYTKQMLDTLGMDRTELQDCEVPYWTRGEKEVVRIINSDVIGTVELEAVALGNSVGTGIDGVTGDVVEVYSLDEVEKLGHKLDGKIVFYNRPMDKTKVSTFNAYGGAVDQRVFGASRAAKFGAKAVLVRSLTTEIDDIPHTGVTVYENPDQRIPALSISTKAAELLSRVLKQRSVQVFVRNTSEIQPPQMSYNVIGEIKGSEFPDEIILVGGHLDSWDIGEGAHDDGTGCVQAMEVIHTLKRLNYKPKRTIRCVLFMNEENGLGGGLAYAKASNEKNEFHLAAIESDAGGFTPRGFGCKGDKAVFIERYRALTKFASVLEPYGIHFSKGGGGADINPLLSQKGLLLGLRPDSQRYFDIHHTKNDILSAVNKRELELGAAAMTSLVYLIDKYGL